MAPDNESLNRKICIGGAQLGNKYGISNKGGTVNEEGVAKILSSAWNLGVTQIDTAPSYGQSESLIGSYLRKAPHQPWTVMTKVVGKPCRLDSLVDRSIERMGRIPSALLAHNAEQYKTDFEFRKHLRKTAHKFAIRKIGVSVYHPRDVLTLSPNIMPDIVQLPINLLDSRFDAAGCLDMLKAQQIEVHARSVFLQGLFFLPEHIVQKRFPSVATTIRKLTKLATLFGVTVPGLSLLHVCRKLAVDKVVLGITSQKELEENMNILQLHETLEFESELEEIKCLDESVLDPRLWNKT